MTGRKKIVCMLLAAISGILSCTHPPQVAPVQPPTTDGNFPAAVSKIMLTKCATSGCHNAASYHNAAELRLDSWEHLFEGSVRGAQVIAYSPLYSPLLYYCNTDSTLGPVANNPGHLNVPVTRDEYIALKNWVAGGAPDKNGNIPFGSDASTRQKIYLTNQGCDLLAVIDAKSRQVMRYIKVGADSAQTEAPHDVVVSSDGAYAYVSFFNGKYLQKVSTATDQIVAGADISKVTVGGVGQWGILNMFPQDTAVMVTGYTSSGYVVTVNTATMQVNNSLSVDALSGGTEKFVFPHGIEANATFDTFLTVLQFGNVLNKFTFSPSFWYKYVSIDGKPAVTSTAATTPDPHQVRMAPDFSKYFITCQNTAEVRVMDARKDTLIKVIAVGTAPKEMTIAPSKNYLFVTCMEDAANPQAGRKGSVYVIDIATNNIVKTIYGDFYQPHDVAVDERNGLFFVVSRNASPAGPAPHHVTACGGRTGWYSVYNLNTLEPADSKRYEVTVDPYAMATRFR